MYRTKGGGGFAAEDANALHDAWNFQEVDKVGVDRSKNGPDRIVGDTAIQSKYCQNARSSVNNAFDGAKGQYRYSGQKLEVPSDQYEECIKIMQEKIRNNQVPGVSDPAKASEIVKRGNFTYTESQKLREAWTTESIKFDVKSQTLTCGSAAALSAAITYLSARSKGASEKEALKKAGKEAGASALTTGISGVATQQFLRTAAGRATDKAIESVCKEAVKQVCKTHAGRVIVTQTALGAAGKEAAKEAGRRAAIAGAKGTVASIAKSNLITGTVVTVATSATDVYRYAKGDISGKELTKNTASRAAGVAGGSAGWAGGAALGTAICPGVGTVIGALGGAVLCGTGASTAVHKALSWFGL